jgi:hypothetical protein
MGLSPIRLLNYLIAISVRGDPEEGVRSDTRELAIAHKTTLQRTCEQFVGVLDDLL